MKINLFFNQMSSLCMGMLLCTWTLANEPTVQDENVRATNIAFSIVVPLNQKTVSWHDPSNQKEICLPVVLKSTGRFAKPPVRYQLLATGTINKALCDIALPNGGTGWKLFSRPSGTNYLAWVSWSDIGIKLVSPFLQTTDAPIPVIELASYLPPENISSDHDAINCDIEILNIAHDSNGSLIVKARDPAKNQNFMFTLAKNRWRCCDANGRVLDPKQE